MYFDQFLGAARTQKLAETLIASPLLCLVPASVHACTQLKGKRKQSTIIIYVWSQYDGAKTSYPEASY